MSKIYLKENKKMKLQIPEFNCDYNVVGEHLNKYDMLKHFNAYSFDTFIGKPGSGKTSLLIGFLTGKKKNKIYRKSFNNVIVVMPSSSRNSMVKNPFKNHHEDKMYDELNLDVINDIYNKLLNASSENENSLLIMDDVGASLKNMDIQKQLKTIIYNRRHLKTKIIMLCQSFQSMPREIRKLINNIIMFKPSKVEFEKLFEEMFETKKDVAFELLKFYKQKHDYLMLNVDTQRIYYMFDEIIIEEKNLSDK